MSVNGPISVNASDSTSTYSGVIDPAEVAKKMFASEQTFNYKELRPMKGVEIERADEKTVSEKKKEKPQKTELTFGQAVVMALLGPLSLLLK